MGKRIWIYIVLGFFGILVLGTALDLGFGWFGVYKTSTVRKAMQNAQREVFEETQSYVEGKRQEASKLFAEWRRGDDTEKKIIESQVRHQFANFDETKLAPELEKFVHNCKYSF